MGSFVLSIVIFSFIKSDAPHMRPVNNLTVEKQDCQAVMARFFHSSRHSGSYTTTPMGENQ